MCSLTFEEASQQPWRRMSYHGVSADTMHRLHAEELRSPVKRFYQNASTFDAGDWWLYPSQVRVAVTGQQQTAKMKGVQVCVCPTRNSSPGIAQGSVA
jgi:hypothetical protein